MAGYDSTIFGCERQHAGGRGLRIDIACCIDRLDDAVGIPRRRVRLRNAVCASARINETVQHVAVNIAVEYRFLRPSHFLRLLTLPS